VRALAQILQDYGARPPTAVVHVVSDARIREEVSRSTSALEAVFRQQLKSLWARLCQVFPTSQPISHNVVIDKLSLGDLSNWLRQQNLQLHALQEWIEFRDVERCLDECGVRVIIDELLGRQLTKDELQKAFLARFYRQWLDAAYWSDAVLKNFRVSDHESILESFRALDRDSIDGAYKRIRTKLLQDPDRPHSGMLNAPPSSELGILLRESARKRPKLPLRQLFRKIPLILRRLKPCLMMSPLAVSTFLDTPDLEFDVVIFDEASQVRPYDAIGAIYRGKQLIVAGDQKQLPPTSFFDRLDSDADLDESSGEEEEEVTKIGEYESILDVCCSLGMPRKRLRWHYRSRRESLISFSNRFFYDSELITFPSVLDVHGSSAVTCHFVENGRWVPGQSGGFNPIEAKETAAVIVKHFESFPDRSLGVITLNQRQQFAVMDELDKIRRTRPDLAEFFSESRREPFFVKNLENVQGDERDHIILGVAYGFDSQGKFAMRFGPLNQQGGERRLNVAVTRARYATVVVTSIRAEQIDLSRTKARGAMLMRSYLDFASHGIDAINAAVEEASDAKPDSEFEAEVERTLSAQGFNVRRQIGCSGFRIDLAIVHPERPGRFVLGIECDGATYHSSATARDRDRLRQEVLEGLGWRICRVWSTDWIRSPDRQIERIVAAYKEEVARCDEVIDANDDSQPDESEDRFQHEERPVLRIRRADDQNGGRSYANIDAVSDGVIRDTVLQLLRLYGQTTRDELIKSVAKQLGFQRTGRKIQQRLDSIIEQMAAQGRLSWAAEGGITASG
jgi:very-short-patch-repair endonuclease